MWPFLEVLVHLLGVYRAHRHTHWPRGGNDRSTTDGVGRNSGGNGTEADLLRRDGGKEDTAAQNESRQCEEESPRPSSPL